MKRYMDLVLDINRHLVPYGENFVWFDEKKSKEIKRILGDLKKLLKDKPGLEKDYQIHLQKLYEFLKKTYSDYTHHKPPKNLSGKGLDQYLESVCSWFDERYRIVNRSRGLRRLYKKVGCDFMFGKKIDIEGEVNLKGPAVLISTHNIFVEPELFQAISDSHIFFVGDVYLGTSTTMRVHKLPGLKWLLDSLGILQVDRKNPIRGLRDMLKDALHILEKGGVVGIFPLGSTEALKDKWKGFSHGGAIGIIQYAEKNMGIRIPIIPAGVKEEDGRFIIRFGRPYYIDPNMPNRREYAEQALEGIRRLAA